MTGVEMRERLQEAIKDAMRAKDELRLSTLRLMSAALKDQDIAKRGEDGEGALSQEEITNLFAKMVKQRHDSIKTYTEGGRPELAQQEQEEIDIIESFLPKQLSEDELYAAIKAGGFDGVLLSNGPGDPEPCAYAIEAIREFIEARLPLFGICLGHQLLALAAGARTIKMKFGHHGANHPVQDLDTKQVMITSQNHGFAVDEDSLPAQVRATHRSLFDGSLQGIRLTHAPAFGFQGHPEASPGPHDIAPVFDRFIASIDDARSAGNVTVLRKA